MACCWCKLKRAVDPKLNLVVHFIDALSEFAFSILIINFLYERYVYHLIFSSIKPRKDIFLIKMLWSIVPSAFCKSIRTIPVKRPESKPFVILSWRYDKQVSVEWNFLKPDRYLCRTLLSYRKFIIWSWITHSIILEIRGSSGMGLKFIGSDLRPFLYKDLIFATLHLSWKDYRS